MVNRRSVSVALCAAFLVLALPTGTIHATATYQFQVFTTNGDYNDSPNINVYMEVFNGVGTASFKFFNNSTINSSITNIYFDDGSLLGIDSVINSAGVLFAKDGPTNIPGASNLFPAFEADREFNIAADPPPYHNGVNNPPPEEWVQVTFNLLGGGTIDDVLDELSTGELRVGIHIQGFDDGSSESAIAVPEPASIFILSLGALALARKRRV